MVQTVTNNRTHLTELILECFIKVVQQLQCSAVAVQLLCHLNTITRVPWLTCIHVYILLDIDITIHDFMYFVLTCELHM